MSACRFDHADEKWVLEQLLGKGRLAEADLMTFAQLSTWTGLPIVALWRIRCALNNLMRADLVRRIPLSQPAIYEATADGLLWRDTQT